MKKIFYYPFLILFFLVVFFSFGEKVFAANSCFGLEAKDGVVCSQASPKLKNFFSCLRTKQPNAVITIIGDYSSKWEDCKNNWSDANCIHGQNSCHYGGKIQAGNQRTCTDGSHAVDLRTRNLNAAEKNILLNAAKDCGAKAQIENDGGDSEHIHASVGSCACDGWDMSLMESLKAQTKDLCIAFNVPIPGIQEFLTQKCPDDDSKYLVTSETVALYINAVYKYGAGFAGLVAIFMIVFAAWQWIMAAGNSGKIDNAKDTIIASLVGLTLLFGGYLLLSQISSRLVNLKSLEIKEVPTDFFDQFDCAEIWEQSKCVGQCEWKYIRRESESSSWYACVDKINAPEVIGCQALAQENECNTFFTTKVEGVDIQCKGLKCEGNARCSFIENEQSYTPVPCQTDTQAECDCRLYAG